jgi:Tfp pilus assembly protein PilN
VALLGLDLNGQPAQDAGDKARAAPQGPAGSLKIAAEAETARDMLNYLAFLSQQPLFRSVYLVKHEQAAGDQPRPYRFQLEAQWRQ